MSPAKGKGKGEKVKNEAKEEKKSVEDVEKESETDMVCFMGVTPSLKKMLNALMPCFLKTVVIVGQESVDLQHIAYLTNVVELWITECNLEEVPFITSKKLEKLFLHQNDLDYIPDLTYLPNIRVLWLNDNRISNIENLCKCAAVEDLNLANNSIKHLDKIVNAKSVKRLNLSGNPITDVEEIKKLKSVKTLKHLMFADPLYKISPIANVLNYRTIIVYNLPFISTLDTYSIGENEIKNADDYFRMKKIYYSNMFQKLYNGYYVHLTKKMDVSNVELLSIKQRLVSSIMREKKASQSENTELQEKCKWEQRHLDNEILKWDTSYKQQDRQKESIIQMNMKILDFEMSYAGNILLSYHDCDTDLALLCQQLIREYACPFTSKEAYVEKIVVDNVTHIVDKLSGSTRQLEVVNSLKSKGKSAKFYILVDPVAVKSVNDWPFDFLQNFFNRCSNEDQEKTQYVLSNCMAIADSSWLNSNEIHKKIFLTNSRNSKRLAVLICVPPTLRLTKVPLPKDTHGGKCMDSNSTCAKFSVRASNCFPVFIVQFHYIYQDLMKAYEKIIRTDKKEKDEQDSTTILSQDMSDVLQCSTWGNLVELSLTKSMLSTFGDRITDSFPNVKAVDVSFNNFEKVDEFFMIFPSLQTLNMAYNNLPSLLSITSAENLEKLNVSWNNLNKLCPNLQHLKSQAPALRCLDVSYNSFDDIHFSIHEAHFAKKIIPFLRKYNDKWMTELDSSQVKTFEGIYDLPVIEDHPSTHIAGCNAQWTGDPWCQIERNRGPHVCVSMGTERSVSCLSLIGGQHFHKLRLSLPLPELTSLTISSNLLEDLSFLKDLPKLRRLDLSRNTLTSQDVTSLPNSQLLYLDLSCNYFTTLDFIKKSNLYQLKVLNISMNKIKSLKGLENLSRLEELYAPCNYITSYDSIKTIKYLQHLIIIDISNNKLPNIRDAKKYISDTVKNIEYINGSPMSESEIIDTPSTNSSLDADYLLRFYKITALHSLTELSVCKASISRVHLDGGVLNHLTSVNLEGNQLDRLCELACLPQLINLCLSHNRVKKFRGKDDDYVESSLIFEKLETLHLDDNGLTEVEPLELYRMPCLKTLFLQDNLITTLAGLYKAKNLTHLILDRNRLRNIQPLDVTGLHAISQLYLENNFLENLQFLSSLPKITRLFIANNRIYDFVNLHWLSCTKQITELTISGNPVNSCGTLLKFLLQTLPHLSLLNGYNVK